MTDAIADLHEMNRSYVRAAEGSDVRWYDEHLDRHYMCSNPDGSLVDRAGFLGRIGGATGATQFESVDPRIRVIGDLGIVQSGFRCLQSDGQPRTGCYTDVWSWMTGSWLCTTAHFAMFHVPMQAAAPIKLPSNQDGGATGRAALEEVNRNFIRSVRESDSGWFDANLDADFLNSNPDGSLSERAAFVANVARPSAVPDLDASHVVIRILGDVALIHARTHFTKPGGVAGSGRYTDIWLKGDGGWRCVSAHVTRG